jgi:hypothetical protein
MLQTPSFVVKHRFRMYAVGETKTKVVETERHRDALGQARKQPKESK